MDNSSTASGIYIKVRGHFFITHAYCIVSLHAGLIALITVILQDLHQLHEQEDIF